MASLPGDDLALASVGDFLIIEGREENLAPFAATAGTLLVPDLGPYLERVVAGGGEIVHPPVDVPSGRGFTARHPGDTLIEYVHHRPAPEETGH